MVWVGFGPGRDNKATGIVSSRFVFSSTRKYGWLCFFYQRGLRQWSFCCRKNKHFVAFFYTPVTHLFDSRNPVYPKSWKSFLFLNNKNMPFFLSCAIYKYALKTRSLQMTPLQNPGGSPERDIQTGCGHGQGATNCNSRC